MIVIVAQNKFREDKIAQARPLRERLIEKSREEKGCLKYDLYQDMKDPSVLTFIEEWTDEQAIEAHNNSAHFKEIVPQLGRFVADKDVRLYKKFR